jgi:hypothetical protein
MKWLLLLLFFLSLSGCDYRKREEEIKRRQDLLSLKEQELILKEKSLAIKEADLLHRERFLDSTLNTDTALQYNPALAGTWHVRMTCIEATCKSSAVGDTRNEDWEILYQARAIIVKVISNEQLIRVYTGFFTGNTIELIEKRSDADGEVNMVVRLRMIDDTKMEGQREITRENCKVIYDLKLEKNSD